jgi:hypothetical protein
VPVPVEQVAPRRGNVDRPVLLRFRARDVVVVAQDLEVDEACLDRRDPRQEQRGHDEQAPPEGVAPGIRDGVGHGRLL